MVRGKAEVVDDEAIGSTEYVCERVRQALAADERTAELGIGVRDIGGHLVLSGTVANGDRLERLTVVAEQAADGLPVRNDVLVVEQTAPGSAEPL